eukprot:TRINITY_DN2310_c0_g1_i1.p1 TRINITY_DN2310_c0_g1~~TRINITY_DN2310_c0_g1_i1.p1  ORF type:complete len:149 (+),score=3.94 TRINITY_DN2310_c0_g1_i1:187-633(+)
MMQTPKVRAPDSKPTTSAHATSVPETHQPVVTAEPMSRQRSKDYGRYTARASHPGAQFPTHVRSRSCGLMQNNTSHTSMHSMRDGIPRGHTALQKLQEAVPTVPMEALEVDIVNKNSVIAQQTVRIHELEKLVGKINETDLLTSKATI